MTHEAKNDLPVEMVIYFAHPIKTYGTFKEKHALMHIKKKFPDAKIIDPSIYSTNPIKFKFKHYLERVKKCDIFIFIPFVGAIIGKGIYEELKYAHNQRKKILFFHDHEFYNRFRLVQRGNDWQRYAQVVYWNEEDNPSDSGTQ